MNKDIKIIIIKCIPFLIIGICIGYFLTPKTKIISQTIYKEPEQVIKVQLEDGWDCEQPKMTTDLLQPNGYWIGDSIDCWKLEVPIDEFIISKCVETHDNYWCNQIKDL